jgi:Lon protease-like protein
VLLVEIEGETRFVINETSFAESYLTGSVTPFWEQRSDPLDLQPLYDQTVILFCNYLKSVLSEGNRHLAQLQLPTDPVVMSFAVAASLQTSLAEKQLLLELSSTAERLQQEILILQRGDIVPELVDTPLDEPFPVQTFEPLEASTVKENFSRN